MGWLARYFSELPTDYSNDGSRNAAGAIKATSIITDIPLDE